LISNAQQYTPVGGHIILTAQLRLGQDSDQAVPDDISQNDTEPETRKTMIQINVTDNGIGIAPQDLDKVFDRFFRSDHPLVQETAGTGLGLYITQSLVEMHAGTLWVESELDQGSTFSFTLPLAQNETLLTVTSQDAQPGGASLPVGASE